MSLAKKLNRFKHQIIRQEQSAEKQELLPEKQIDDTNLQFKDMWTEAGVTPYFLDGEFCLIREVRYPLDYNMADIDFKICLQPLRHGMGLRGIIRYQQKDFRHRIYFSLIQRQQVWAAGQAILFSCLAMLDF